MRTSLTLLSIFVFQIAFSQINQSSDGDAVEISIQNLNQLNNSASILAELDVYPAGDAEEGDYIADMQFTPDGSQVWVLNRTTNNITVFNWSDRSIITNIEVGSQPIAMDFTDTYAVVSCLSDNSIYVINLSDYSIAKTFQGDEQPVKVRTSRDGSLAVVGCDINDKAIVIDLNILELVRTIDNFTVYLSKFSAITSNPRNTLFWSDFEITPDNQYLINPSNEDDLQFFEISTGNVVKTITGAGSAPHIALSGDGNYAVCVQSGSNAKISRINIANQSLENQYTFSNNSVFSFYSKPGINMDGSKVFVPVQTGNTALVDLVEGTEKTIATGNTPDWVGQSHDYKYAIASDFYMAVISFETGAIISSINGISIQNGAVSKRGNQIIASDPLRNEVVLFYEFESPGLLNFIESRPTGSDLEADATYSVSFTPDGEKVVAVNSISGTVSILTTATGTLEKIIDLNTFEIYHAGITPDGKYALIAKRNTNTVAVIDLETLELAGEVNSGGVKPDQVFITPDGKNALAINAASSDACGVISLDGTPSYVKQFSIANTGISWTNFGIRSSVEFDPIGPYAYLAAPFDEKIQVIDLQSLVPVYSLPLTGFPLQMAISDETEFGIFTAVTQKTDNALAIIGGSGNNISLIGSYPCGNNPTRVAYNPAKEQFAVTCTGEGTLEYFDINTLSYESPVSFGSTMSPISVKYSKTGHEYVLLRSSDVDVKPHQLLIDGTSYDIPSLPMHNFEVSSDGTRVAIPLPATDEVALFLNGPSGWEEKIISTKANFFEVFPNPVVDFLNIKETEVYTLKKDHQFILYDGSGKLVWNIKLQEAPINSLQVPANLKAGSYFYKIKNEKNHTLQSGKVLIEN